MCTRLNCEWARKPRRQKCPASICGDTPHVEIKREKSGCTMQLCGVTVKQPKLLIVIGCGRCAMLWRVTKSWNGRKSGVWDNQPTSAAYRVFVLMRVERYFCMVFRRLYSAIMDSRDEGFTPNFAQKFATREVVFPTSRDKLRPARSSRVHNHDLK